MDLIPDYVIENIIDQLCSKYNYNKLNFNPNDLSLMDFTFIKAHLEFEKIVLKKDYDLDYHFKRVWNVIQYIHKNISSIQNQVQILKNSPQIEQRTPPWYEMRNNMITASDWAAALAENPYNSRKKLLLKKSGLEESSGGSFSTDWGTKYEPVANLVYEFRYKTKVNEFGLLQHPEHKFLGASPDGITDDGIMIEIKCPTSRKITKVPPHYYWVQVQGQLEICNLEVCHFFQCEFKEYETGDFSKGDFGKNNMTKNGQEKGVMIKFIKNETPFYEYSEIGLSFKEMNDFIIDRIMYYQKTDLTVQFEKPIFWYLNSCECTQIYRDKLWFKKAYILLKEFWDEVISIKQNGRPEYLETKPKVERKKIVYIYTSEDADKVRKILESKATKYDTMDDDTYSMVHRHFEEGSLLKKCSFSTSNLYELASDDSDDCENNNAENDDNDDNDDDNDDDNNNEIDLLKVKKCLFRK
jgi:putative phage-type endonuclease